MVYQPMLEVLAYLRANGFKTFIVSGGGIEFMRPWTEQVYGIPPEQVVGSSIKTKFEMRDGKPVIVRLPELNFNDDKDGKPVGINQHIGRRPIAAFGNSEATSRCWNTRRAAAARGSCLLVLHDDAAREYAYGPANGLPDVKLVRSLTRSRRSAERGLDRRQHEERLEDRLPVRQSEVTAIDILLEPDATMLQHAEANNARLLEVFPKGFALDATHRPHITMIQRFVRTADLDKVYAAAGKVLAAANVKAMKLEAFKYYYAPAGAVGVAGICAKPTPEIQAASGHHCRRCAVHGGNRPHRRVHRSARRSRHRRGPDPIRVDVCAEDEPARTSIRTSAPASPREITSTRCSPNRSSRSPSRPRVRPFTSSVRSARRRRSSKNGIEFGPEKRLYPSEQE